MAPAPSLPEVYDFEKEKLYAGQLISTFDQVELEKCLRRRKLREYEVDVEAERSAKRLAVDETKIPIRRIHSSILRIKPQMDAYLTQSKRLLIFKDKTQPGTPCEDLEMAFSEWIRVPGWNSAWEQINDATLLHGGCGGEIVYDPAEPFHSKVQYIPREDLIFNVDATDIQKNHRVIRRFRWCAYELQQYAKEYGFTPVEAKKLYDDNKTKPTEPILVYRVYVKYDGIVYVYWYHPTSQTFLKPPEPLESGLGIENNVRTGATTFPLFYNTFMIIEDTPLLKIRGLAYWQLPAQEGETEIITSQVNGAIKASKVYASQEVAPGGMADASQTEPVQGNVVLKAPIKYHSPPMPTGEALKIAMFLNTEFSNDTGQVNFAAMNRTDSRKTAREMDVSVEQSSAIGSVFLSPLAKSTTIAFTYQWEIGKAAILRGAIPNFPVPPEKVAKDYHTFSAGSVDYVQRQEKKQTLMQLLPQLGSTPFGGALLELLLRNFLPEDAEKLLASSSRDGVIQSLLQVIQEILPTVQQTLTPQENARLQSILNAASQVVGGGNAAPAPGMAPAPANEAPPQAPGA